METRKEASASAIKLYPGFLITKLQIKYRVITDLTYSIFHPNKTSDLDLYCLLSIHTYIDNFESYFGHRYTLGTTRV